MIPILYGHIFSISCSSVHYCISVLYGQVHRGYRYKVDEHNLIGRDTQDWITRKLDGSYRVEGLWGAFVMNSGYISRATESGSIVLERSHLGILSEKVDFSSLLSSFLLTYQQMERLNI